MGSKAFKARCAVILLYVSNTLSKDSHTYVSARLIDFIIKFSIANKKGNRNK